MKRDKIRIPRKVEAKFDLFGLGWKEMLFISPFGAITIYMFATFENKVRAVVLGILIVGIPYALLTQSKYGRSGLEQLIDMVNYFTRVQKRYDWSWSDEDIPKQVIRYEAKKEKGDYQTSTPVHATLDGSHSNT